MMRQTIIMSAASHSCSGSVQPTRTSTEQDIGSMVFLRLTKSELLLRINDFYVYILRIYHTRGLLHHNLTAILDVDAAGRWVTAQSATVQVEPCASRSFTP